MSKTMISTMLDEVKSEIVAATVPLFIGPHEEQNTRLYKLDFIGNGVYVQYEGHHLILTAQHVMDDVPQNHDVYFRRSNEYSSIPGKFIAARELSTLMIDFGFWLIHPECTLEIPHRPIPQTWILPRQASNQIGFYAIVGYPASAMNKRMVVRAAAITITHEEHILSQYDPNRYLVMKYDRKNQQGTSGPSKGIKPEGMSGCGVYYCTLGSSGKVEALHLVGIFTDYCKKLDLLIAERISYAMSNVRGNSDFRS